jgi:hypothetical protein
MNVTKITNISNNPVFLRLLQGTRGLKGGGIYDDQQVDDGRHSS